MYTQVERHPELLFYAIAVGVSYQANTSIEEGYISILPAMAWIHAGCSHSVPSSHTKQLPHHIFWQENPKEGTSQVRRRASGLTLGVVSSPKPLIATSR